MYILLHVSQSTEHLLLPPWPITGNSQKLTLAHLGCLCLVCVILQVMPWSCFYLIFQCYSYIQFPCAFALNLTLSKETLLRNIKNSHSPACAKPPSQDPRDASSDQGDEMDTSRTKRRFALYEKSVKDFLYYFSLKDRIVRVDTSAAQVQHVWEAMMDFFAAEMDFSANRVINTVVLFSFGKFQTQKY